jgi:NAD(P)-dependent dehydrogenase (short-subunit alcohol dehydrogenase family)
MSERFQEKVVVVTGAGSGIGAAAAARFLREGAHVIYADISQDRLDAIEKTVHTATVQVDVANPDSVQNLVNATIERFGGVDVLVSNAGIWQGKPFLDITDDDWARIMSVNLTGTFLVCRDFARAMVKGGKPGAIVVTASTNSFIAELDSAHYNATKGGVALLIQSMAIDLAPFHIRVNGIAPGTIRTNICEGVQSLSNEGSQTFAFPPARRWGEPEDCAGGIAFLASDDADYVTGSILVIDGGQISLNGVIS